VYDGLLRSFIQSSAITRKLDKIHTLLLKNADDLLYDNLKELAIPAQTYGM
jgi:DNA transposition AAA+ family ATPase